MSLGMFLGQVANGFNSATQAAERISDRNAELDDRKFQRERKDRVRREWADEDADLADRKKAYEKKPDATVPAQPPAPSSIEPAPSAARTTQLDSSEAPSADPAKEPGLTKPVESAKAPGYGLTFDRGSVDPVTPTTKTEQVAASPATTQAAPVVAPTTPKARTSGFANEQDETYYNLLRSRGRLDQAEAHRTKSFQSRELSDRQGFVSEFKEALKQPGGINNPTVLAAARDSALNYGQFDQYMSLAGKHDALMWSRSSQAVDDLAARSKGMTPEQIAREAAKIFNDDIGAGNVSEPIIKDGKIYFKATNKINGQITMMPGRTPEELISSLSNFYKSPETLAAIKKQNDDLRVWKYKQDYEHRNKVELEREKGANKNGVTVDENGNLVVNGPQAKGKGGKAGGASTSPAYDLLFNANEKSSNDAKLTPDEMVAASNYIDNIVANNPALKSDPSLVARLARDIQRGEKTGDTPRPTIDFKTGRLVRAYRDAQTGTMVNLGQVSDSTISKEQRAAVGEEIAESLRQAPMDGEMRNLYQRAASGDQESTKQLYTRRLYQREEEIRKMIDDQNRMRTKNKQPLLSYSPQEIRQQAQDAVEATKRIIQLMGQYGYKGN